jgi:hypothetical protein
MWKSPRHLWLPQEYIMWRYETIRSASTVQDIGILKIHSYRAFERECLIISSEIKEIRKWVQNLLYTTNFKYQYRLSQPYHWHLEEEYEVNNRHSSCHKALWTPWQFRLFIVQGFGPRRQLYCHMIWVLSPYSHTCFDMDYCWLLVCLFPIHHLLPSTNWNIYIYIYK